MNVEGELLILIDIGLTLINLVILVLGVKLYTDQRKQALLRGEK